MKKLLAGLVAAFALVSTQLPTQAIADGTPRSARYSCCDPARSWSGFYLGAGIGAGAAVHELNIGGGGLVLDGFGGDGIFGTITVGYDHQIQPGIVAGIFFDVDFSKVSTDLSVAGLFSASLEHDTSWSIGARLGWLASRATLWYALAGYTEADFDLKTTLGSVSLPHFKGYFLGAGVETQLPGNWSLRGEYRFTQFDAETVASFGPINVDLEPSMHTGRLVLTYKFGRRDEAYVPVK